MLLRTSMNFLCHGVLSYMLYLWLSFVMLRLLCALFYHSISWKSYQCLRLCHLFCFQIFFFVIKTFLFCFQMMFSLISIFHSIITLFFFPYPYILRFHTLKFPYSLSFPFLLSSLFFFVVLEFRIFISFSQSSGASSVARVFSGAGRATFPSRMWR